MNKNIGIDLVKFSVKMYIRIFIGYFVVRTIILSYILYPSPAFLFVDGILRLVFTMFCIRPLGNIVQDNGLKFIFSINGFKKGILSLSTVFLWMLIPIFYLIIMSELNLNFISMIPAIIFFDISSAIFEETLWRGIFMTAILYQWSDTVKGRVISVIISGIVFAIAHIYGGIVHVLIAFILGISFSSAYLYSKNLLSLILVHALWNILIKISNGLIIDVPISSQLLQVIQGIQNIIFFIFIPIVAIVISIKSQPFQRINPIREKMDKVI